MKCRLSLTCVRSIGKYKMGDRVTDETEVAALLKGRDRYRFSLTRSILREIEPASAQVSTHK
jgi:hypothetical protein